MEYEEKISVSELEIEIGIESVEIGSEIEFEIEFEIACSNDTSVVVLIDAARIVEVMLT